MTQTSARAVVQNALDACSLATPDKDAQGMNGDIPFASRFEEIGFDSLAFMEFCISVHVDTGIEITVEDLREFGTPDAVVSYLEKRL